MYLRVSVTDRCNLRCFYCLPSGYRKLCRDQLLSFEDIIEFVRLFGEVMGIDRLRITGGEPLVRKDIDIFLRKLSCIGVGEIGISTNGILLGDFVDLLVECGIRRVNVSLDTLDRNKFKIITGMDFLDRVIMGIVKASESGMLVKINTVALAGVNVDEACNIIKFAAEVGAELRFIEFMPFSHIKEKFVDFFIPYVDLLKLIGKEHKLKYVGKSGVAKLYFVEDLDVNIGFITPVSDPFCLGCNRVRLTSDGKIRPCLHATYELDVSKALKERNYEKLIILLKELALIKKQIKPHMWEAERYMVQVGG